MIRYDCKHAGISERDDVKQSSNRSSAINLAAPVQPKPDAGGWQVNNNYWFTADMPALINV